MVRRLFAFALALSFTACGSSSSGDVAQTSASAGGASGAGGGGAGTGGAASAGTGGAASSTGGAAGASPAGTGGAAGTGTAGNGGAGNGGAGAGNGGAGNGGASAAGASGAGGAVCSIPEMCEQTKCCGGPPSGSCDFTPCEWTCPATMLCPNLMVIPGGPPGGGLDAAIVMCVMKALRDGTEGALSWSQLGPTPGGSYGENLTILPARKVLRETSQQNDLAPPDYTRDGPSPLGDAAMFDACVGSTDANVVLNCLQKAAVGCGP